MNHFSTQAPNVTDGTPWDACTMPEPFPFSALIGQEPLQRALLLAAVDPGIGGVLISGPRGTAKSTAARALAAVLPPSQDGQPAPFVTLPLAATMEQLAGTLSVEHALRDGRVRFSPGLLARAHAGVLYVDEVNLLHDSLVDALLDAAAGGIHTVERDGISHRHAARFVLLGTMNPEEGELRPQLMDRFGLSVTLFNPEDLTQRMAILRVRLEFDEHPLDLAARWAPEQGRVADAIATARRLLGRIAWSEAVLQRAAARAMEAGVDGMRADIVMLRAARALAALEGRTEVLPEHVDAVSELALAHRRRQEHTSGPRDPAPQPWAPSQAVGPRAASGDPQSPSSQAPGGDWGALAPLPESATRVSPTGAWPEKKA